MRFASTFLFAASVAAQYGGGGVPAPATTSSTAAAAAIPSAPADTTGHVNINVAPGGKFVFSPANVTASNGTSVTFWFPPGTQHSVTQSSFANPCTYLTASSNNTAGFDSGLTDSDQFTIIITDDTKPIWFFCKQVTHCGSGMVGSINAQTTNNTFDAFMSAAKSVGGSAPSPPSGSVTGGFNAIASAGPSNTGSAAPAATTAGTPSAGTKSGITVGAVALSLISALFALA